MQGVMSVEDRRSSVDRCTSQIKDLHDNYQLLMVAMGLVYQHHPKLRFINFFFRPACEVDQSLSL